MLLQINSEESKGDFEINTIKSCNYESELYPKTTCVAISVWCVCVGVCEKK